MKHDIEKYEATKTQADNIYKKVGSIKSPALGETVFFTSEGFNHLMFKGKSERTKNDQMTKFKILPAGIKIIKKSTTFQEYAEFLIEVTRKKKIRGKRRTVKENVLAKYWCFIAIMDGLKVKTIVRQVGTGKKHFWSVVPNWNINKYSNFALVKKFKGDPEED